MSRYIFYISDPRDYAECCRYAIERGFFMKHQHGWFAGGDILEKKIEEDRLEHHKYFYSFKSLEINYSYRPSRWELSNGIRYNDNIDLGGINEFKTVVNFLSIYSSDLISLIEKQTTYKIKKGLNDNIVDYFNNLK